MQYWYIPAIVFTVCIAEWLFICFLRNNAKASMRIVFATALFILAYKTVEYSIYRIKGAGEYPVEFSQFSYFIYGAVAVAGVKKLYPLAGYCATLTGIGNMMAMIVATKTMVTEFRSIESFVFSIIIHNMIFFGGLLLLFNSNRFKMREIWISLVAFGLIALFIQLVRLGYIYKDIKNLDRIVIIKVMNGKIFEYIMPRHKVTSFVRIFGTTGIMTAVVLTMALYYKVNNVVYDIKSKKLALSGQELKEYEIGLYPLLCKAKFVK